MRRGGSGVTPQVEVCVEGGGGGICISWAKQVYYWIFRIFMEDGIGKMQIALGVVAYCSFILFIQSYGLELLDLEEKVKLV